jgi:hypothetical protein
MTEPRVSEIGSKSEIESESAGGPCSSSRKNGRSKKRFFVDIVTDSYVSYAVANW